MEITWGHCPHVPKQNGGLLRRYNKESVESEALPDPELEDYLLYCLTERPPSLSFQHTMEGMTKANPQMNNQRYI